MIDAELKNILNDLVNKFAKLLNVGLLTDSVFVELKKGYDKGLNDAENQFNLNFTRNEQRVETLQKYVYDNIKGMNDDLAEKLRQVISRGILNFDSVNDIQKEVQKVMNVGVERARVIARTEMVRAQNMGHIDGARQTGLKLWKQWDAHLDARTSPVCSFLNGKKVGMNSKFVYQGQEFDSPPAHPNCFLKNTKITMSDGTKKNIQDIEIGDVVRTHKRNNKRVYNTIINETNEYYEINVGTERRKKTIKVTGNHSILTQRGWIKVKDLTINDYLVKIK